MKVQESFVDLAIRAARRRYSPRTRFVHLDLDTIPLYENFSFGFALFRQKSAESIAEAKELFLRLLGFQLPDGRFPVFLHDYPRCFDPRIAWKIAPIFLYLFRYFSPVLGELKEKLQHAFEKILHLDSLEDPLWKNRSRACRGQTLLPLSEETLSFHDWTDWVITQQLVDSPSICLPYHVEGQFFQWPYRWALQERQEPAAHPLDWVLAEGRYPSRLLLDHPHQLQLPLLFPFCSTPRFFVEPHLAYYWQGSSIHSLIGEAHTFLLTAPLDGTKGGSFEVALYCNRSKETSLLVEGKRANTFRLKEKISIVTPAKTINLRFHLVEGEGDFFGHIFPGNRPQQIAKEMEAYDWQIALRTVRRSDRAKIEIEIC